MLSTTPIQSKQCQRSELNTDSKQNRFLPQTCKFSNWILSLHISYAKQLDTKILGVLHSHQRASSRFFRLMLGCKRQNFRLLMKICMCTLYALRQMQVVLRRFSPNMLLAHSPFSCEIHTIYTIFSILFLFFFLSPFTILSLHFPGRPFVFMLVCSFN